MLIKVPLRAMILIYITTWSNTSKITAILLFNSWTAILLWGNHCIYNRIYDGMLFWSNDDITNMLQDLTCYKIFLRETLGKHTYSGNFFCFTSATFYKTWWRFGLFFEQVVRPYLKNYFKFVYCSLKVWLNFRHFRNGITKM